MTKRIITFVLCLALCVSCVAVGVINQTAKDSNSSDTVNGALTGAALETIAAGATVGEAGSKLVEGETAGTYVLTDNVTIENADDPTYKALASLFNRTEGTDLVLDGGNKTITTSIPLFDNIANTTIKNLTVTGAAMTVKSDDLVAFDGTNSAFGIVAAASFGSTKFDNVNVDVDFTINGLTSSGNLYVGSIVGYVDNGVAVSNSTNDGNITVIPGTCSIMSVGGLIGYIKPVTDSYLDADNCVNNGDIYAERTAGAGDLYIGGISGHAYRDQDKADFCLNTGNIYGKQNSNNAARIGGMIGHCYAPVLTDCINLGNVTAEAVGDCVNGRAGGFLGHQAHGGGGRTQTRCINAGTITLKVPKVNQPAGGIAAWGATNPKFKECVNLGQVIAINTATGADNYMGGITSQTSGTTMTDCYSVEPKTERSALYTKINADTFSTTAGTASGSSVSFGTSMNKGAYDIISGVIRNFAQKGIEIDFEFGAIITLAKYDEVIDGDFTHAIFDAYLAANKTAIDAKATANNNGVATEINALYMTASFPAGDGLEANGDNYIANISLGNAYDTTYIARTYIKIGDVYFYSFSN